MAKRKSAKYIIDVPMLMCEWNFAKNKDIGLFPEQIATGNATKKIWWKCLKCGYEWQATAGHRTDKKRSTGCPKCAANNRVKERRKKILTQGNIQLVYPHLLAEWDFEKNTNIKPEDISKGSHNKIWWKCKNGHSWQTAVGNRIKGHGCPYCSGRLAITGLNDLLTVNPILAREWNYEKNGDLKPELVTANSQKKVWWLCPSCGHEWQSTIGNRNKKRGCPACSKYRHVSIPEKAIAFYLSQYYLSVENNKKFDWLQNMELDIFIPDISLAIEYDGRNWHKSLSRDIVKDKLCVNNGIDLIRVREIGLEVYQTTAKVFITQEPSLDLVYLQPVILEILEYIRKKYDSNCIVDVNVQRDYYKILSLIDGVKAGSSLGEKFPELLDEWNYAKNGPIDPYKISSGSSRKVWWICKNGHEWKTAVSNRTNVSNQNKCPYCQTKRVTKGENDLISINAPFLVDWDYSKNSITPDECTLHSGKEVWWKCHKCGHEWKSTVDARSKHGCFKCSRHIIGKLKSKPVENIDTHKVYPSATIAERELKLYAGAVGKCCRGERKTAGGYHWKYVE